MTRWYSLNAPLPLTAILQKPKAQVCVCNIVLNQNRTWFVLVPVTSAVL